jgi:hypothetical protein
MLQFKSITEVFFVHLSSWVIIILMFLGRDMWKKYNTFILFIGFDNIFMSKINEVQ